MNGEQLHLSPAESGDLYVTKQHVAGVITSGGRPIKIHVRGKAKQRYKRHVTGRKAPYGTQTKHHYMLLHCPRCGRRILSIYRIRHTYKSIHNWLRKAFNAERYFKRPTLSLSWYTDNKKRLLYDTSLFEGGNT
jgi:hypothetical protein